MGTEIKFEPYSYNINLTVNNEPFGQYIHSISIVSSMHRMYPKIILELTLPQSVYMEKFRKIDDIIELKIDKKMEKIEGSVKKFYYHLAIIDTEFVYPRKSSNATGGAQNDMTTIQVLTAPQRPYLYSSQLIPAKVYRNMTMKDIVTEIVESGGGTLELEEKGFNNFKEFEEIFIPTLSRRNVLYFLNKWYGFYESPFLIYVSYKNEKGASLNDEDMLINIAPLNKKDKDNFDINNIIFANTANMLVDKQYLKTQREAKNIDNIVWGSGVTRMKNFKQPLMDGYYQRYTFKPLDHLYIHKNNMLGKKDKEAGKNDMNKKKIYVLSKDSNEAEVNVMFGELNVLKTQTEKTMLTGYRLRDKAKFNQWLVNFNDATVTNSNFSLYVTIDKGIHLEHFLTPGRLINLVVSPDSVQLRGLYFLDTSVMKISKDKKVGRGPRGFTYQAQCGIKISRANVNHDIKTLNSFINDIKNGRDKEINKAIGTVTGMIDDASSLLSVLKGG